jgi:hypothetical protein
VSLAAFADRAEKQARKSSARQNRDLADSEHSWVVKLSLATQKSSKVSIYRSIKMRFERDEKGFEHCHWQM